MTNDTKSERSGTNMPTYVIAHRPNSDENIAPVPVLEQAQVMRVWIAPWADSNKDLHWPGLMFTEVRPRQWHFGEEAFDGIEPPVPHAMMERQSGRSPAKDNQAPMEIEMPKNEEP